MKTVFFVTWSPLEVVGVVVLGSGLDEEEGKEDVDWPEDDDSEVEDEADADDESVVIETGD